MRRRLGYPACGLAILAALAACGGRTPTREPAAPAPPAPARGAWPAWACPVGPVVGAKELDPTVAAGTYQGGYAFSRAKFITMEHDISENVRGAATLTLAEDGSLSGCIGIDDASVGRISRYASPDKQDHTNRQGSRTLLGLRGRWQPSYDGARLMVERIGWKGCDAPEAEMSPSPVQLVCGLLAATPRLPTRALACRAIGYWPQIEKVTFDLGEGKRAGAWSMRWDLTGREAPDPHPPCGPWLLLGEAPGLMVVETDDAQAELPTVTFTSGTPEFDRGSFVDKPDAGAR
jgi:hypothetical protein